MPDLESFVEGEAAATTSRRAVLERRPRVERLQREGGAAERERAVVADREGELPRAGSGRPLVASPNAIAAPPSVVTTRPPLRLGAVVEKDAPSR